MDNMERFVEALEIAQNLAKDIPGIARINWSLYYYGTDEATKRVVELVNKMQEKNGNIFKE